MSDKSTSCSFCTEYVFIAFRVGFHAYVVVRLVSSDVNDDTKNHCCCINPMNVFAKSTKAFNLHVDFSTIIPSSLILRLCFVRTKAHLALFVQSMFLLLSGVGFHAYVVVRLVSSDVNDDTKNHCCCINPMNVFAKSTKAFNLHVDFSTIILSCLFRLFCFVRTK